MVPEMLQFRPKVYCKYKYDSYPWFLYGYVWKKVANLEL